MRRKARSDGYVKHAFRGNRSGIALLAVVWGIGLIAILVVPFMTSARLRTKAAHNIATATRANLISEAASNLGVLWLISKRHLAMETGEPPLYNGAPTFCVFDDAAVAIVIEEEDGKINLNTATPQLLERAFIGLGFTEKETTLLVESIATFRAGSSEPGRGASLANTALDSKGGRFETVMELDQVSGFDPITFRLLIPFLTVHSTSGGLDARSAPPALFAALAGFSLDKVRALMSAPFPNELNRNADLPPGINYISDNEVYLIHTEALLFTGALATMDTVVDLRPNSGNAFAIKEIRHGQPRYATQLGEFIAEKRPGISNCTSLK